MWLMWYSLPWWMLCASSAATMLRNESILSPYVSRAHESFLDMDEDDGVRCPVVNYVPNMADEGEGAVSGSGHLTVTGSRV